MRRGLVAASLPAVLVLGSGFVAVARAQTPTTYVYFDQKEEEDLYVAPSGPLRTGNDGLVPPWDPNGQLCIFPDGSGRFVVGYNPTQPSQTETPGRLLPHKQPPVGEAIYDRSGHWTGRSLSVPGPYTLGPSSPEYPPGVVSPGPGGDIPPDSRGAFNPNGTFTGCAFDARGNLFAADIGTSQGSFPPDPDGRIIEWFRSDDYSPASACIVYGPDHGGVGPHHVDGTGGLQQPGIMATDAQGNLYVPVDASDPSTMLPQGEILVFPEAQLPATPEQCTNDQGNEHVVQPQVFIAAWQFGLPFPQAIARDPVCSCWAVDNVIGATAVMWFDDQGRPVAPTVHLPIAANFGTQFTPLGMAFDPQGNLFLVDIHVTVNTGSLEQPQNGLGLGPANGGGRLLEFSFAGPLALPPTVISQGEDYPVSVTTCSPGQRPDCPFPAAPSSSGSPSSGSSPPAATGATQALVTGLANTSSVAAVPLAPALAGVALVAVAADARRRRRL